MAVFTIFCVSKKCHAVAREASEGGLFADDPERMREHSSQKPRDCYRPGINPKIKGCIGNKEAEEYIKGTVKGTVKGTAKGNRENAFTSKCQDKKTPNGGSQGDTFGDTYGDRT